MSLFPAFLKLRGRWCVVVGGGKVAEGKIASLLDAEAQIVVVAPEATDAIAEWAREGRIQWHAKLFERDDLTGAFLAVAATSAPGVNHEVFLAAEVHGILCNAVDDPDRCNFYYPAVVRRGALQIAISTAGLSPALSQRLRRELEEQFGPEYELWIEWLGAMRSALRAGGSSASTRLLLHALASREMFEHFVDSWRAKTAGEKTA